MIAYIAQISGTQKGIAEGMYQHISIRVTRQTQMAINLNSP
jgi:hypothetical protein